MPRTFERDTSPGFRLPVQRRMRKHLSKQQCRLIDSEGLMGNRTYWLGYSGHLGVTAVKCSPSRRACISSTDIMQ